MSAAIISADIEELVDAYQRGEAAGRAAADRAGYDRGFRDGVRSERDQVVDLLARNRELLRLLRVSRRVATGFAERLQGFERAHLTVLEAEQLEVMP